MQPSSSFELNQWDLFQLPMNICELCCHHVSTEVSCAMLSKESTCSDFHLGRAKPSRTASLTCTQPCKGTQRVEMEPRFVQFWKTSLSSLFFSLGFLISNSLSCLFPSSDPILRQRLASDHSRQQREYFKKQCSMVKRKQDLEPKNSESSSSYYLPGLG